MGFPTQAPSHQAAGVILGILVICLGSEICASPSMLESLHGPKESCRYPRCPPGHGALCLQ